MNIKNKHTSLIFSLLLTFSLLLIVMATNVSARLLTPLTTEVYVQVEIAALEYQILDLQQRLGSLTGELTALPLGTSLLDALYKKFNTNYMEHLRYGDARKKEINRWLKQQPQQASQLKQLQHQMERLSSQLESREAN